MLGSWSIFITRKNRSASTIIQYSRKGASKLLLWESPWYDTGGVVIKMSFMFPFIMQRKEHFNLNKVCLSCWKPVLSSVSVKYERVKYSHEIFRLFCYLHLVCNFSDFPHYEVLWWNHFSYRSDFSRLLESDDLYVLV